MTYWRCQNYISVPWILKSVSITTMWYLHTFISKGQYIAGLESHHEAIWLGWKGQLYILILIQSMTSAAFCAWYQINHLFWWHSGLYYVYMFLCPCHIDALHGIFSIKIIWKKSHQSQGQIHDLKEEWRRGILGPATKIFFTYSGDCMKNFACEF